MSLYEENGASAGILDLSTFVLDFFPIFAFFATFFAFFAAFLAAFFAFFAAFLAAFFDFLMFLAIWCVSQLWLRHRGPR